MSLKIYRTVSNLWQWSHFQSSFAFDQIIPNFGKGNELLDWGDFLEETIQPAILKNPKSMPEEQYQKQASLKTTKLGLLILLHITMTLQNITFYKN